MDWKDDLYWFAIQIKPCLEEVAESVVGSLGLAHNSTVNVPVSEPVAAI